MNEIEITQSPFANDQLDRKHLAENLATIILQDQKSYVFSINASWGKGKTYFIDNLMALMEKDAFCIKYNAWETDYFENPLIPVCSEISEKFKTFMEKDFDESLIVNCVKNSRIGVNLGILSLQEKSSKTLLDLYKESKDSVEKFREFIIEQQQKIQKPIIIFVDELDRCRPDYAIKTLEIIKHFFDIKKVKFVIAVDNKQITNSIKTIYGENTETSGYLRKFIDLEFFLPEPSLEKYARFLYEKYAFHRKLSAEDKEVVIKAIKELSEKECLDFSLRDIEKIFIRFSIILNSFNQETTTPYLEILIALIILKQRSNNDYLKISKGIPTGANNLRLPERYRQIFMLIAELVNNIKTNSKTKDIYDRFIELGINLRVSPNEILSYFDKIEFAENFEKKEIK